MSDGEPSRSRDRPDRPCPRGGCRRSATGCRSCRPRRRSTRRSRARRRSRDPAGLDAEVVAEVLEPLDVLDGRGAGRDPDAERVVVLHHGVANVDLRRPVDDDEAEVGRVVHHRVAPEGPGAGVREDGAAAEGPVVGVERAVGHVHRAEGRPRDPAALSVRGVAAERGAQDRGVVDRVEPEPTRNLGRDAAVERRVGDGEAAPPRSHMPPPNAARLETKVQRSQLKSTPPERTPPRPRQSPGRENSTSESVTGGSPSVAST